jgi:hypothetical protein
MTLIKMLFSEYIIVGYNIQRDRVGAYPKVASTKDESNQAVGIHRIVRGESHHRF